MSYQGSEFEQVVELVFQNVQYLLTVSLAPGDTLCVEAEHKMDGSRWRGDFTARYVEDITQKTGNYKKFAVFVKMLRSAILQESDSVFVDLLTYQDLEMLKNRTAVRLYEDASRTYYAVEHLDDRKIRDMGAQSFRSASNNKRYLILTYTGEFDRVHYPLPLLYEENPEPEALKRTIRRLRNELEDVKGTLQKKLEHSRREFADEEDSIRTTDSESVELQKLREENSRLTEKLTCMEDSYRMFGLTNHTDRREVDEDRKRLERELVITQKKCELLFSKIDSKKDIKKETQALRARLDQLQEAAPVVYGRIREMAVNLKNLTKTTGSVSAEILHSPEESCLKLAWSIHLCRDILFCCLPGRNFVGCGHVWEVQEDLRSERSVHRKAVARFARDNATLTQDVRSLRDAEKRLRMKMRESESELDILKRRLKVQGARDLPPSRTRPRGTFSVPSTRLTGTGSRRASPLSTRANTPTGGRITPPGSRPSSCPSFGSNARNRLNDVNLRRRSPREVKERHTANSQPSSARSRYPYAREISRSEGRGRPVVAGSSRRVHETISLPIEVAKAAKGRASRESQRYARQNTCLSPDKSWRKNVGLQPLRGLAGIRGTGSTPNNGLTSDDEPEVLGHGGSRVSSPSTVLRDVKAKLHKYAKMEGIDMSDTESRGTSGSYKDFNGDSFSQDHKSVKYDVVIEASLEDEKVDKEVMDIDSRLHALQHFLKTAKASVK